MAKIAVLLDVMSIQQYVFTSNTLIDNLGASHIVENLFVSCDKEFEPLKMNDGGGNVIMLFNSTKKEEVEAKIQSFTRKLLVEAPGLILGVAITDDFDDEIDFKKAIDKLHKRLHKNKNNTVPNTQIPMHGITAECQKSGLSVECFDEKKDEWISSVLKSKRLAAGIAKEKDLFNKLTENASKNNNPKKEEVLKQLKEKYIFTDDLEKLGQIKGEDSHIAVVHIDGNDMGEKFKNVRSWDEYVNLSRNVKNAVEISFVETIKCFDNDLDNLIDFDFKKQNGKTILPIRPIILGGDDITFVSEGRLGVYFALEFMNAFANQKGFDNNNLNLTSCAGVSIVKTKYPFYRANQIATELCINAKKNRKNKKDNGSYLDFHISYGGLGNSLEEIRKGQYINNIKNSVLARPYNLDEFYQNKGLFDAVKEIIKQPNTQIKELRQILYLNESEQDNFLKHLKFRNKSLPTILGYRYDDKIFHDERNVQDSSKTKKITHILDIIELSELYPNSLLK